MSRPEDLGDVRWLLALESTTRAVLRHLLELKD